MGLSGAGELADCWGCERCVWLGLILPWRVTGGKVRGFGTRCVTGWWVGLCCWKSLGPRCRGASRLGVGLPCVRCAAGCPRARKRRQQPRACARVPVTGDAPGHGRRRAVSRRPSPATVWAPRRRAGPGVAVVRWGGPGVATRPRQVARLWAVGRGRRRAGRHRAGLSYAWGSSGDDDTSWLEPRMPRAWGGRSASVIRRQRCSDPARGARRVTARPGGCGTVRPHTSGLRGSGPR